MIVIAVDPGLSGAVACLCETRGLLELADLPVCENGAGEKSTVRRQIDGHAFRAMLKDWSARHQFALHSVFGVIERMQPFGKGGPVTMMSIGYSAGLVEGVLSEFATVIEKPAAKLWKQRFGLTNDKSKSAVAARMLFGDRLPKRLRHDKAEAALLARWGVMEFA